MCHWNPVTLHHGWRRFFAQSIVSCVRGDGPTMDTPPRRTLAEVDLTPRKKRRSRSRSRSQGYWDRLNASLARQQRERHAAERREMRERHADERATRRLEAESNWMRARHPAEHTRLGFADQ